MEITTILKTVKDGLCTGCGTCISICPREAISMTIDNDRYIYIPQLNHDKCANCGICYNACPGHGVDFKDLNLHVFGKEPDNVLIGNYISCYIGNAVSYDIRYNSSSGGIITALLIFSLENGLIDGAIVTRMRKDTLEPESFIARTKEEIIDASKSKYCPVPVNVVLKDIIKKNDNERFAIVGLPCHIQGLRKAQMLNSKLREKIVMCIGLFCAHTDNFLATRFTLYKYGIKEKDISSIEYRGRGWPGSMSIELKNGDVKIIPYKKYMKMFHGCNFFTPRRCLLCNDATCELADIVFGDAWNIEDSKLGSSILISRTKYGENLLICMDNMKKTKLAETNIENIVTSQKGLIYNKKIGFKLRMAILKIVGKKTPNFVGYMPKNSFISFDTILPYVNTYASTNRQFFGLLRFFPEKLLYCYGSISSAMANIWLIYYKKVIK